MIAERRSPKSCALQSEIQHLLNPLEAADRFLPALSILVDGYNLLFQTDLVGRGRGPGWLEQARDRLCAFLAKSLPADQLSETQIVFDANDRLVAKFAEPKGAETVDSSRSFGGLTITFANGYDEADDLLEEIIHRHPHPKTLTVVTSDHRVQRRALARRAIVVESEAFFEQLQSAGTLSGEIEENPPAEKEQLPSEEEVEHWLSEFSSDPRAEDESR